MSACSTSAQDRSIGADSAYPRASPELTRRADSLERLDPDSEAIRSANRGDFRFVGVCGYTCSAVGLAADSIAASPARAALDRDSLRLIEGTADYTLNADMARLNRVAPLFADGYDLAMLRERRRRHRDQPPNER